MITDIKAMKEITSKDFEEVIINLREEGLKMIVPESDGFKLEPKNGQTKKQKAPKIYISGDKKHTRSKNKAEILRTPIEGYDLHYLEGLEDVIKDDHEYIFNTFKDLKEYLLAKKLEEDPDWEINRDFERMIRDI